MMALKRVAAMLAAVLLTFSTAVLAPIGGGAFAAEYIAYDYTDIESDLANVNISSYPKDPLGRHRLLDDVGFMEYAYSESTFISGTYYGLYFYVYNPTEKAVVDEAGANVVNMAVSYDGNGEPTSYKNCGLKFLDATANNRFLKFKLEDPAPAYETAHDYAEAHEGKRRYDIAGIQLLFKGDPTATDSLTGQDGTEGVSFTYYCTGYCAGCDLQSDESSLEITYKKLDTISLNIKSTWYRTDVLERPNTGMEVRNTLSSVYFSVPNYYIDNYGALQIIKAQWNEYRTSLVLVTDSDEVSQDLKRYAGYSLPYKEFSENTDGGHTAGKGYYDPNIDFSFYQYIGPSDSGQVGISWNYHNQSPNFPGMQRYDWAIKVDDITKAASGDILEEYARSYPVGDDKALVVGGRSFNKNLFTDDIDEGHIRGFNEKVFDARDKSQWIDLKTENNTSGWDQFWNLFIPGRNKEDWLTKEDIKPIEELTGSRVNRSDYEVSNDILVDESELGALRSYVTDAEERDETTFLLRFSLSEYDSVDLTCSPGGWFQSGTDFVGFQDAVYLGFDIIYLGFVKEDAVTVIPCVADPIDVFPSYTPSDGIVNKKNGTPGWIIILIIVAIIVLIILLFPILPYILQFVWWLIKLPFRLIGWIGKKVNESKKKRKEEEPEREAERRAKEKERRAKEEAKKEKRRAKTQKRIERAERISAKAAKEAEKREKRMESAKERAPAEKKLKPAAPKKKAAAPKKKPSVKKGKTRRKAVKK